MTNTKIPGALLVAAALLLVPAQAHAQGVCRLLLSSIIFEVYIMSVPYSVRVMGRVLKKFGCAALQDILLTIKLLKQRLELKIMFLGSMAKMSVLSSRN